MQKNQSAIEEARKRYTAHVSGEQDTMKSDGTVKSQEQDDFIEDMDDACIRYDGGRVTANESLIAEIKKLGLRKPTKQTGLDRKTIRAILSGRKVKGSTLAKVVIGMQQQ